MSKRSLRLCALLLVLLLTSVAGTLAGQTPRCVIVDGLTYCCWGQGMCRVCDSENCYILPGDECPQNCPS
jgi:hypothetical protein